MMVDSMTLKHRGVLWILTVTATCACGLIQQLHGVQDREWVTDFIKVAGDLGHASNIAGDQRFGSGGLNRPGLAFAELARDFGLLDVVRAGGTAADVRVGYFKEFQAVHTLQQCPRFGLHRLSLREMAGVMICDPHGRVDDTGSAKSQFVKEAADVADFRGKPSGVLLAR